MRYNGGNNILWIDDNVSKNIDYLNSQTFSVGTGTDTTSFNKNIGTIVALQGVLDLKSTASTTVATGLIINANNHEEGVLRDLIGARIGATTNKGTVSNLDGLVITSTQTGGTISNNHRGINLVSSTADNQAIKKATGISNRYIHRGIIEGEYIGVYNSFEPQRAEATVGNFFGYRLNLDLSRVSTNTEGKKILATNAYGLHIDDVNFGSGDNYAIYTKAGQIRFGGLADTSATGDRVVAVDKNGVLKVGSATANNGIQNESTIKCDATNAGKINYTTKEINGVQKGIFGFCMQKGSEYVWAYMVGGANIFGTSANGASFGDGL